MREFDRENADVNVYTFKDGLLSSMAHDLRIEVPDFTIEVDHQIRGEIDLRSLKVASARKNDKDAPDLLTDSDHAKIEKTMRTEVLHTERYPYAILEAELDELVDGELIGYLELHGEEREVTIKIEDGERGLIVEMVVHQPDFGIRPYSAMLGSLKVRADVKIIVVLYDLTLSDLEALA
jgi:polyisoprenoid-binding protein YceI